MSRISRIIKIKCKIMKKVLVIALATIMLAGCGSSYSVCSAYAKHPGATNGSCSR